MVDKNDILAQFLVLYAKAVACNAAELHQLNNKKKEGTHHTVHMGDEKDILVKFLLIKNQNYL